MPVPSWPLDPNLRARRAPKSNGRREKEEKTTQATTFDQPRYSLQVFLFTPLLVLPESVDEAVHAPRVAQARLAALLSQHHAVRAPERCAHHRKALGARRKIKGGKKNNAKAKHTHTA